MSFAIAVLSSNTSLFTASALKFDKKLFAAVFESICFSIILALYLYPAFFSSTAWPFLVRTTELNAPSVIPPYSLLRSTFLSIILDLNLASLSAPATSLSSRMCPTSLLSLYTSYTLPVRPGELNISGALAFKSFWCLFLLGKILENSTPLASVAEAVSPCFLMENPFAGVMAFLPTSTSVSKMNVSYT